MHRISTNLPRSIAALAVATALAGVVAASPAASAAVPKTGIWRGELQHDFKYIPQSPNSWKPPITITALDGRIKSVATTVRMECSSPLGITDLRVVQSWRTGRGPRISRRNGAFSFRADGVYFHGNVSRSSVIGGAGTSRGEFCTATARFNAQRRR